MKLEYKEKWVKMLRSGEYKQTKHILQDDIGYCCLGVLRECLPEDLRSAAGDEHTCALGTSVLTSIQLNEVGLSAVAQTELATANDGGEIKDHKWYPCDFNRIADIIEEKY